MTTAAPSAVLAKVQPVFTDAERVALAGFLAGYRGLTFRGALVTSVIERQRGRGWPVLRVVYGVVSTAFPRCWCAGADEP
jgi:hypothetical protein